MDFQGCFKGVSRSFRGKSGESISFQEVSRVFQMCSDVFWSIPMYSVFRCIPNVAEAFEEVFGVFQEVLMSSRNVTWESQEV